MADTYISANPCLRGHKSPRYVSTGNCIECGHQRNLIRDKTTNRNNAKRWSAANKDRVKENIKKWLNNNPGKKYSYTKKWGSKNQQKLRDYSNEFKKKNRKKCTGWEMARQLSKRKAMPSWVNRDDLDRIYESCPNGFHVDHIIPITSKIVCGLHVPWNLQYLPALENIKKGNRFSENWT